MGIDDRYCGLPLPDGTFCDLPDHHILNGYLCESGGRQRAREALAEDCERIIAGIEELRRRELN